MFIFNPVYTGDASQGLAWAHVQVFEVNANIQAAGIKHFIVVSVSGVQLKSSCSPVIYVTKKFIKKAAGRTCAYVDIHAQVNTVSPDMANHGYLSHTDQSNGMQ